MRKTVMAVVFLAVAWFGGRQDAMAQTTMKFIEANGSPLANVTVTLSGIRKKEIITSGKNVSIKEHSVDIFGNTDAQGIINVQTLFRPITGLDVPNELEVQYLIGRGATSPIAQYVPYVPGQPQAATEPSYYIGRVIIVQNKQNIVNVVSQGFSKEFIRGDANNDYVVDVSDAILIFNSLQNLSSVTCYDALDADDNGTLNYDDGKYVLSYLFYGGKYLQTPFPYLGLDVTADNLGCVDYKLPPMAREIDDEFLPGETRVVVVDSVIKR